MDLRLLCRDAGHLSDLRLPLPALPPKRLVVELKQAASLGTLNFQAMVAHCPGAAWAAAPCGPSDRAGERWRKSRVRARVWLARGGSARSDPGCGCDARAQPKGTPQ